MRAHVLCIAAATVALCGCPKNTPDSDLKVDAGTSEAELIAPKVDAIETEIAQVVKAVDETLWSHWTTGAAVDLDAPAKGHDALYSRQTLDLLRRARTLRPNDGERIDGLARWLAGELLTRGVREESDALANLEASATFMVDGKELALRELGKVLLSERSAVKRRAIWAGSHAAAMHLDAAYLRRDTKMKEVLTALGLPGPVDFAAQMRGLETEALGSLADALLTATDAEWKTTLEALSDNDVKLPVAQLSRADLPRLLKVPAVVDAAFPKTLIASRAQAQLGDAGVVFDVSEGQKKNPLPLTVEPTLGDVRVSIKPVGGLRDQQLALAEVGTALELWNSRSKPFGLARLESPEVIQRVSDQMAQLTQDEAWLTANGISENRAAIIAMAKALKLFQLRRAAGVVLARLETEDMTDEVAARARYVAIMSRALGMTLSAEEGARWRVESFDFLRSAALLPLPAKAERK